MNGCRRRRLLALGIAGLLPTVGIAAPVVAAAADTRVEPRETDELLANPGMGWQTFHRFADALFQAAHFRLIRQLGARYDGHPDLDLVDIGSVGLWGEWHMSNTAARDTGKPVPLPSEEMRLAIIDAWCRAFPKTSKVILIGSELGMTRAVAAGYGWRADCLGDLGGFSKTWNHMDNMYRQQIARTGARDVWQQAPVAFESCWDMRKWKQEQWDIRYIFDYALECHASYLNNKSAPLPEGTRPEIERFLRRLGYRLVVRRIEHARSVPAGGGLTVKIAWDNLGVAPPYRDDRLALRLQPDAGAPAQPVTCVSDVSIRGWLPGSRTTEPRFTLPAALRAGRYTAALGVVDPIRSTPTVRLALAGRDADGWYPFGVLEVTELSGKGP